jgi:hypothetical protein
MVRPPPVIEAVDLEKTLLCKVGEAVGRFRMIRDGDRIAVALSGGKDSVTMLEAILLPQKRAPSTSPPAPSPSSKANSSPPSSPSASRLEDCGEAGEGSKVRIVATCTILL